MKRDRTVYTASLVLTWSIISAGVMLQLGVANMSTKEADQGTCRNLFSGYLSLLPTRRTTYVVDAIKHKASIAVVM